MFENEEGANVQEVAAPDVTDNPVDEPTVEENEEVVEQPTEQKQSDEVNAQFAAVRRKAEEDAQKRINGEFKRLFGNVQNPVTGRNIETYEDYIQAVEYQQRATQNRMLEEKGIDPAMIEQMINNSPTIRQAQQVLAESNRAEAQRQLESDLKVVSQIAPEIKTIADLEHHSSYNDVLGYVQKGLSLQDAFKLANYNSLSTQSADAAKQAAINQARGKSHMQTTTGSISNTDNLMDIPESEISRWKEFFPGASMKELKEKYNRVNKQ